MERFIQLPAGPSEGVTHKFIALRRPQLGDAARSALGIRRATLSQEGPSQHAPLLREIGLKQVQPEEESRAEDTFARLGPIGAYVVQCRDAAKTEQAMDVLADTYDIVPNIPLSMPRVPVSESVPQLRGRPRRSQWPATSGIAAAHAAGIRGAGVIVGVLDTGCDADHAEFARKRVEFRHIPPNPSEESVRAVRAFDTVGHGTHVCGIIAGRSIGIAPEADLLVASVIESETVSSSLERILFALSWMVREVSRPENQGKTAIVSMSLGFTDESIADEQATAAIAGLRRSLAQLTDEFNVLPIVAIGNDGEGHIRAPGYFPEVISVGAVDFEGATAWFSSSGLSPVDQGICPDLSGYGVGIVSSYERTIEGQSRYKAVNGTSMATPYVAGIAALIASANPGLPRNALRERIMQAVEPLADSPHRVGAGLARFL